MIDEIKDNLGENNVTVDESQHNSPEDAKATRHAQQMAGAKAEVERLEAIALEGQKRLAAQDANNLLELYKSDPKLANKVAKEFGYSSFEEAKSVISGGSGVDSKLDDDFEVKYARKRAEERHQEALEDANVFIEKAKLDDEQHDAAKVYFDKITEGRQLTRAEAIEYADMATLYVQKERIKEGRYQEGLKEIQSTGISSKKPTPSKSTGPTFVVRNGEMVELLPSNDLK